jgi:DNA-binding CsgD family transcriptional regulator
MGQSPGKRRRNKTLSAHEAGRVAPRHRVRYNPDAPEESPSGLTAREEEVLSLIAQNKTNQEISSIARIAVATVEKHIENIYPKLRLKSSAEAAVWLLTRKIETLQRENADLKQLLARLGGSSATSNL